MLVDKFMIRKFKDAAILWRPTVSAVGLHSPGLRLGRHEGILCPHVRRNQKSIRLCRMTGQLFSYSQQVGRTLWVSRSSSDGSARGLALPTLSAVGGSACGGNFLIIKLGPDRTTRTGATVLSS